MKKKKQKSLAIEESLAGKIPYACGYEEEGMIRVGKDRYTRMYEVSDMDPEELLDFDAKIMHNRMEELLNGFPGEISMQFLVHNSLVDPDAYLSRIVLDPEKTDADPSLTQEYDRILIDHATVGHNNVKKTVYFILACTADLPEDAILLFRRTEKAVNRHFQNLYGRSARGLSLVERLKVMYSIFHPGGTDFGKKIDLKGDGTVDLTNLKYMKMTTKDLVAPDSWNTSVKLLNHSILNEKSGKPAYARAFFLNVLPKKVSPSFVSDLTSVSGSMLFSMIYEPVDTKVGFEESAERVRKNTTVTKKAKRDTIADRKNRVFLQVEEAKELNEETYYEKAALSAFKDAFDRSRKTFLATMTIVLFNEDIEALEKDSALLTLSAAKFSASINCLDMQQCEGLQSSLPLCTSRLDVSRMLDIERLAGMSPVGVQDTIKKNGLYCGLNTINDTLILLNRKNNVNLNGFITGTEHAGKTYQNKREIVNALLGSRDTLHVITMTDEYDAFAGMLHGLVLPFALPDLFAVEAGYGLIEDDYIFKSYFLEAVISSLQGFEESFQGAELEEKRKEVEEETGMLMGAVIGNRLFRGEDVVSFLRDHRGQYPYTVHALDVLSERYDTALTFPEDTRLQIHRVHDLPEMLMMMDALWNKAVGDKKQNRSDWIFIDPADTLLMQTQAADYLAKYQTNANMMQTILTVVVENSASLLSSPDSAVAYETVLQNSGYIKLLSQGPKERKRLTDVLNIPHALTGYITNVEPGKGVIITPSSNIPFNDNCNDLYPDSAFKNLFLKEVEQIRV